MDREMWVPHDEFFERFGERIVLDRRRFPWGTVLWFGVRAIYTEFSCDDIGKGVRAHPDAQVWTEHEGEGGELFYTFGVGLVNRTGTYVLVRKDHRNRFTGWLERAGRRLLRRGIARRA